MALTRTRTWGLTFITMVFAALLLWMGSATSSAATSTQLLRPNGDISSQWNVCCGVKTAWDALNDNVTQAQGRIPSEDFIHTRALSKVTEVALSSVTLGTSTPSAGKAWFYMDTGAGQSVRADVIWGGSVRGTTTVPGGSGYAWRSISVVPPDQASLDDLRIRFTVTSAGSGSADVFATYFELTTTSGAAPAPPPPPPPQRTLTVTPPTGSGSGTITSTGINCPGDCSETYADGTAVTLSANPAAGSTFGGWSGACSGTGSCQVTMNADKTVSGSFSASGGFTHDTVIDQLGPGQENQVYEDFHGVWQSQSGTFVCQVDAQPEQSCNTPVGPDFPTWYTIKYNGLAPGDHTFKVTAIEAGVRDPSPAKRVLNIPATPSYTLSAGAFVPASVNPGGTATATVTIVPSNGYSYTGVLFLVCTPTSTPALPCIATPVTMNNGSGTGRVVVGTSSQTPIGTYSFSISGADGNGLKPSNGAQSFSLVVTSSPITAFKPNIGRGGRAVAISMQAGKRVAIAAAESGGRDSRVGGKDRSGAE